MYKIMYRLITDEKNIFTFWGEKDKCHHYQPYEYTTEEEAKDHPKKNVLMKALGANEKVDIDIFDCDMNIDEILLSSDGLTSMLNETQIEKVIVGAGSLEEKVTRLIRKSNVRGGTDNISIACLMLNDVEGEL